MKILLVSSIIAICVGKTLSYAEKRLTLPCPDNEFRNWETQDCEQCSGCGSFMYIRKECGGFQNTQCGWCGSRVVVENEDFKLKCEPRSGDFSVFSSMKVRIRQQMEELAEKEPQIVEIKARAKLNSEEDDPQKMQEYEDKMEKTLERLVKKNFQKGPMDTREWKRSQAEEENENEYASSEKELTSEEIDEEIVPLTVHEEEYDSNYGDEDISDESEELEQAVEEIQQRDQIKQTIPIKIVMLGERADEAEQNEPIEWTYVPEARREFNHLTIIVLRVLMFLSIFVMFWSIFRAIRCFLNRYRVVYVPAAFSPEQEDMINRCSKTLETKENCYENRLAYV